MIESIFKDVIEEGKIEISRGVYVSLDNFKRIFKDAETYDDFVRIDDGKKGYKSFFDKCKEKGIFN